MTNINEELNRAETALLKASVSYQVARKNTAEAINAGDLQAARDLEDIQVAAWQTVEMLRSQVQALRSGKPSPTVENEVQS